MNWQPIETAPKDGSMFLCWVWAERWSSPDGNDSSYPHDVSQIDFCWWRSRADLPDAGYFDAACGQIGDRQDVTHWMPLPAAPGATPAPAAAADESLCLECQAIRPCTGRGLCVALEHKPSCLLGMLEDDEGAKYPCTCGAEEAHRATPAPAAVPGEGET